jgi:hypothetical protein
MRTRGAEVALRFMRNFRIEEAKSRGAAFLHQMWQHRR